LNAAGEIKQGYWTNVSLEQLLQWDPDEIVLVQYAPYQVEDILQDVKWQGIRAVKNKKVYRFPSLIESWDMPTPSSILGILWFTHHLHPGEYPESEFANDVTEFYEKFYGVKIPFEEFGI
jgi:iron complex transport system substrate-binding protein